MRILILQDDFPPSSLGGAGIIAYRMAKALVSLGHEVFVATAVQNQEEAGENVVDGIKIFRIYSSYHERWGGYFCLYNYQTSGQLRKLIAQVRPDVVHAHNVHRHLSYFSLKIARSSGAKVFLTAHDVMLFHYGKLVEFIDPKKTSCEFPNYKVSAWQQIMKFKKRYNPFRNMAIKMYLNGLNGVFAVSEALKQALEQNGIAGVRVIHNGIDVGSWSADSKSVDSFRQKLSLGGKKIILFGGRLSGAKGGEKAIEALAVISKQIPESIMLVIGSEGKYGDEMRKKADDLDVGDKLIFAGWVDKSNLVYSFAISDLVMVPSICFDSFPTVILEAMASGKPVVATCFGGAKEMVRDGITGYIVNPYDVKALAGRTAEILLNSELAKSLGDKGKLRAKDIFSEKKWIEKILVYYQN